MCVRRALHPDHHIPLCSLDVVTCCSSCASCVRQQQGGQAKMLSLHDDLSFMRLSCAGLILGGFVCGFSGGFVCGYMRLLPSGSCNMGR